MQFFGGNSKQTLEGKIRTIVEIQTALYGKAQIMNCSPLGIFHRPGTDPFGRGTHYPELFTAWETTSAIPELKFENVTHVK